jgi:PKD repeat protein
MVTLMSNAHRTSWRSENRRSFFNNLLVKGSAALVFFITAGATQAAVTGEVNLAWDPVQDSRVASYQVHYGTSSGQYGSSLSVSSTSATVSGLQSGSTYYFVARACEQGGTNCSAPSNEVSAAIPYDAPEVIAAAPVASFTATPLSGSAPLTVKFTDASSGSITAWSWSFGNGATSTLQSPTHTYSTAGTYSVSLTVTGPGGTNTLTKSDYVTVAAAPPGGSVSTTGLVAAYGLEETSGTQVLDASGLANHGTLSNATRTTQAIFGQALSFNGYNSLVSVKDSDSLKVTTGLTLVAWIRPDRLNIRQPIVTKQGTTVSGAQRGFMFSAGDDSGSGRLYFEAFASDAPGGGTSLTSTRALTTGAWQHVAVTYQYVTNGSSIVTLYIDGQEVGRTSAAVGPLQGNPQPLELGRYYWSSQYNRYFQGIIDEPRIFDRALTQTEIAAVAREPVVAPTIVTTAPVASFTANGSTASTVSGSAPLTVEFTDTSSGSITAWSWSFGNGATSTLQSPTYTYSTAGTYSVSLTVTGPGGTSTATKSGYVTVLVDAPVADFSSSTQSGVAPLTVNFSCQSQGDISSRLWNFGDNGTSTAATAVHTYTDPGTYPVSLLVSGPGGSDEELKPGFIEVKSPAPTADFSADVLRGLAPLTVNFQNLSSGQIDTSTWSFGDGSSSSTTNPAHTYSNPGVYAVTLTVSNSGGTDTLARSAYVQVEAADELPMEFGELQVNDQWQQVNFTRSYVDPIVVAKPLSANDAAPTVVRIARVGTTGFKIRAQEWTYLDNIHPYEAVSYVVMERGRHQLPDGAWVVAGRLQTSATNKFVSQKFVTPFLKVPVMFAAITSVNETDTVAVRLRYITTTGFQVGMREQESRTQQHATESIDYLAMEPSFGVVNGVRYEVDRMPNKLTNVAQTLVFRTALTEAPLFLADMQTTAGGEPANLRWRNRNEVSVDLWVAEEQSKDTEVVHTGEAVGYFILEPNPEALFRPLAYWTLDASSGAVAADQQNTNDLLLLGPTWQPSLGKLGGALYLDGVDDYADAPDNSLSAGFPGRSGSGGQNFTIAAWIMPERLNDRQPILAKQGTTESGAQRGFMFSAGDSGGGQRLYFEAFANDDSAGGTSVTSSQALTTGEWQHVAVTYQYTATGSSVITLYVNGQEVGRQSADVGPLQGNPQPLNLGRYYWSGSYQRYFKGLIDEVNVFDAALGLEEIQQLASTPLSR